MAPAPIYCGERKRLLEIYRDTVSAYLRAQSAQLLAVTRGEGFLFEEEIEAARKRKDDAKKAVTTHQKLHGCS